VHRSVIVNLDRIKELRAIERGEYEILLENGQAVETSLGLRELKELIEA
jgi:DNA-binding LytR/AlgR family response regulator